LRALDRAAPMIPAEDSHLRLLSELLRVECLIELQKPHEAVRVFRRCSGLLTASASIQTRIRGRFTGARLLNALGLKQQAERLFDEVVARDIEHDLYKDALLDLLYLYGRHVLAGELEKAARACRRALTDASLAMVGHEQMRDLWIQLLEPAQRQAISEEVLRELRQYVSVHWKHPAAAAPIL
jgi:tetratricopeptide (TPR) repeat protein